MLSATVGTSGAADERLVPPCANARSFPDCASGHTAGMQIVRVWTAKGWMVLMSDASHYYANMEQKRPFPAVYNVAELMDGYKRAHSLAASPQLAIPGHDPLVLQRFPSEKREHEGWIARLDGDMR